VKLQRAERDGIPVHSELTLLPKNVICTKREMLSALREALISVSFTKPWELYNLTQSNVHVD
jgi:hypothetical protein